MNLQSPSSTPQQSRIPTYSGFFQIFIKQKWTETRVPKLVYFNSERWFFYWAEAGDSEQKFRGPHTGLSVVWVVQGSAITFPNNKDYEIAETISLVNSRLQEVPDRTKTALAVALAAQKPIYTASATSPDYFPPTGQEPADVFRK